MQKFLNRTYALVLSHCKGLTIAEMSEQQLYALTDEF
jgi:hypothetical protein